MICGRNVAFADQFNVLRGNIQRADHGIENGIHAAHDFGVGATELIMLAAFDQLSRICRFGQPGQFFLQSLQDLSDVVDGLLHLFVIALVGLGDQFVDFAVRHLGQDAIAFADGEKNRIEHGVDAANDFRIGALELLRLSAVGKLSLSGCFGKPRHFLLKALNDDGNIVDGLLHLLVIALVGLGDQLVDLAIRDLSQDAVAFADGQQNRIEHGVDAANDFGKCALELLRLAAIGELPFLRGFDQPRQLLLQALQNDGHIVDGHLHLFVIALVCLADQLVDFAR